MKIVLLHNSLPQNPGPEDQDSVVQVAAVAGALTELGHSCSSVTLHEDNGSMRKVFADYAPDIVFNLVEPETGKGRSIQFAPALLEYLEVPFTGSGSVAMSLSSGKLAAKRVLEGGGLHTPYWLRGNEESSRQEFEPGAFIIKSVWEHASVGLDDSAVFNAESAAHLRWVVRNQERLKGGEWFAERYVEGRECSVSILGTASSPQVLPPAEMVFSEEWTDRPRILGHAAKWDEDSFEYVHTTRSFMAEERDKRLCSRLVRNTRECWKLFGLAGYARVDFRVDEKGTPWIIDVNANPCLSPDAGLAAAASEAGISYPELIGRIVDAVQQDNA